MTCAGCRRELEIGDHYIQATASEFLGTPDTGVDGLVADILGGAGGRLAYCEDCTREGGDWLFETYYGEDE